MRRIATILLALICTLFTVPAGAEVSEVRFSQQTSIAFLQLNVMMHRKLLEKHAAALGLQGVKATYATFNGPDAQNDALLSGAVDIASGGPPGLLVIWDKTHGTAQEVKGVGAMAHLPWLLNSRNPAVKTIRDFTSADRIAMPAVKLSAQAVLLEMAAAKEWGDANYAKLDPLTLSLAPADATIGLLSGGSAFNAAFTVPPFQNMQLKDPAIHTVLNSTDVVGPCGSSYTWTSKRFHDANPKVYRAIVNAMMEASDFINAHKREAAEYFAADTKAKVNVDELVQILSDPRYPYGVAPWAIMKWADFMYRVGRNKVAAKSWKDLFFEEIHDLQGD